jgi:hypothetical protein
MAMGNGAMGSGHGNYLICTRIVLIRPTEMSLITRFSRAKRRFLPRGSGKGEAALHTGLQEQVAHYGEFFGAEKDDIGLENTYLWDIKTE